MSQTNLIFNKRALTAADVSLLRSYGIRLPNMFVFAYELRPHGTRFSKSVTFEGRSTIYCKVPHPNSTSSESARWVFGNHCLIDSFSIVYESNVEYDSGSIIELPEYTVTAGLKSDNDVYTLDGITRTCFDQTQAELDGHYDYSRVYAPSAKSVMAYVSSFIKNTPLNTRDMAFAIDVSHPIVSAGTAFGSNDFPVIIASQGQTYEAGSPIFGINTLSWPSDFKVLKYFINTNSRWYDSNPSPARIDNVYFLFLFRAMGWSPEVIEENFPEYLELESGVSSFPKRRFFFNSDLLDAYKTYVGNPNVIGVPMGYQPGTEHLFAGGFHADRWDTADFYFADGITGGPVNEKVPHPALHGELLSTNSRDSKTPHVIQTSNYYAYKRHKNLKEEYYKPNFIVTKEALAVLGHDIDLPTSSVNFSKALHADSNDASAPDIFTDNIIKTREYTKEKYIISRNSHRHIMVDQNITRGHGGGSNEHDKSVIEALRYFGFIPFGITTPEGVVGFPTAVFVENGKKKRFIEGMDIKPEVAQFRNRYDYRIFISANCFSQHIALHEDISYLDAVKLLKEYFLAQPIITTIDVGSSQLDLETAASFNSDIKTRCERLVLTINDDFASAF